MSKGKWICRYLFFVLVILLCLGFSGYCLVTAEALEAQTQSLEFVDLAISNPVAINSLAETPAIVLAFST